MKCTQRTFLSILILNLSVVLINGQLIVDAGPDSILCELEGLNYVIGGTPSANGGTAPYTYTWTCEYVSPVRTYYASFFLNDTSSSNPVIRELFDSITFYLNVTDSLGNTGKDSITIINSIFGSCLGQCIDFIYEGDSTRLDHCILGGIPPYTYSWSPQESLSNPHSSGPWAKPDTSTLYILTLTDMAGCISKSYCEVVVYPTSIDTKPSERIGITIHPNPANRHDRLLIQKNDNRQYRLQIFDIKGSVLREFVISEESSIIETNDFAPGIYIYRIKSNEKLVKEGKIVIN